MCCRRKKSSLARARDGQACRRTYGGIKEMKRLPDCYVCSRPEERENSCVQRLIQLGIPLIGIV
ncbi:MAG: 30S ribosomal protein S2 [Lachnospiraceae bacterium]